MPKKPKLTVKEVLLLIEGILIAFMLQIVYDVLRESRFYQSIMPTGYWQVILAVVCAVLVLLILNYFKRE